MPQQKLNLLQLAALRAAEFRRRAPLSSCTEPVDNRSCVFNELPVALNL
jgi:hypothetical protein